MLKMILWLPWYLVMMEYDADQYQSLESIQIFLHGISMLPATNENSVNVEHTRPSHHGTEPTANCRGPLFPAPSSAIIIIIIILS